MNMSPDEERRTVRYCQLIGAMESTLRATENIIKGWPEAPAWLKAEIANRLREVDVVFPKGDDSRAQQ